MNEYVIYWRKEVKYRSKVITHTEEEARTYFEEASKLRLLNDDVDTDENEMEIVTIDNIELLEENADCYVTDGDEEEENIMKLELHTASRMLDYVTGYIECAKEDGRWGSIDAWLTFDGMDINVYDGEGTYTQPVATVFGVKDGVVNVQDVRCANLFKQPNI